MDYPPGHLEAITVSLQEHGVAVVRGLLTMAQVDCLRVVFCAHQETGARMSEEILYTHQPPPDGAPGMRQIMDQWLNPYRRPPPCSTRALTKELRPLVCAWLGEDAVLFQDVLMAKHEGHRVFPWHQDFPFWPVDRPEGVIIWAPLDACDATSGCLHLAQGSHRQGIGPAIDLHTGMPQPGQAMASSFVPDRHPICAPDLAPGDAVVFQPLTWHSSPVNRAGRPRRVWASTWLSGSVRWSVARAPRHPLCDKIEDGALVSRSLQERP